MNKWDRISIVLAIISVAFFLISICCFNQKRQTKYIEEKQIIYDTIPYYKPIVKDSVIVRYVTQELPIKKDVIFDTIIKKDSIFVEVPIEQKKYEDSNFTAYVSGFMPNLDSIFVKNRTISILRKEKSKKWSIGLQAGYGLTNDLKLKGYIGIGINYNIYSF